MVLDNLVKGHRKAVLYGTFVQGDINQFDLVTELMAKEKIEAVIHLAAHSLVGESVKNPAKYFRNNIANGQVLLDAMVSSGVKYIVFSSTAAVYGEPEQVPIPEDHPKRPTNPYGFSKLTFEGMLRFYEEAYGLRYISLRYFNAAGADPEAEIGEDHDPETHLIPIVLKTALGIREQIELYGTDYPTPDGTCIRDYIHVAVSQAPFGLKALADEGIHLQPGNGQVTPTKGDQGPPGDGRIQVVDGPRRPGDPAVLDCFGGEDPGGTGLAAQVSGFGGDYCDRLAVAPESSLWVLRGT